MRPFWSHAVNMARDVFRRRTGLDRQYGSIRIKWLYQIIGVMKPEFQMAPGHVDVWMPVGLQPEAYTPQQPFQRVLFLAARIKPGVSFEQAQAWMGVLTSRVLRFRHSRTPRSPKTATGASPSCPLRDITAGDNKAPLLILLLGAVGFVLLIACSNIAGLMVARTSVRYRENWLCAPRWGPAGRG